MIDRNTGESGFPEMRHGLFQGCRVRDDGNIGSWRHDLFCRRIVEPEDRVDHLLLFLFNSPFHLADIDPFADLLFRYRRGGILFTEPVIDKEERRQEFHQEIDGRRDKQRDAFYLTVRIGLWTDFAEDQKQERDNSRCNSDAGVAEDLQRDRRRQR